MSGFLNKLVRGALGDILNKPKTDVGNLPKKEGVSRRGFLAGGGALGAGVLSEIPYKKVIGDLFPRVIPKILPNDFISNLGTAQAKKALTRQLGLDFKESPAKLPRLLPEEAENLEEFLKGNFEPKKIQDLGFPENWNPVPVGDLQYLFKNKSDLNKYLELKKIRDEASDKSFRMVDDSVEAYLSKGENIPMDSNLIKQLEETAIQADIDMFKILRDANNNNALNENFYKQSTQKLASNVDFADPLDRAENYYKQVVEAKKYFGDEFDKLTPDEISDILGKNSDRQREIADYLRQLDPSIPTPKNIEAESEALIKFNSALNALQNVKLRQANPKHMKEFFEYQQKNNFTDEEMESIVSGTLDKAEEMLDLRGMSSENAAEISKILRTSKPLQILTQEF